MSILENFRRLNFLSPSKSPSNNTPARSPTHIFFADEDDEQPLSNNKRKAKNNSPREDNLEIEGTPTKKRKTETPPSPSLKDAIIESASKLINRGIKNFRKFTSFTSYRQEKDRRHKLHLMQKEQNKTPSRTELLYPDISNYYPDTPMSSSKQQSPSTTPRRKSTSILEEQMTKEDQQTYKSWIIQEVTRHSLTSPPKHLYFDNEDVRGSQKTQLKEPMSPFKSPNRSSTGKLERFDLEHEAILEKEREKLRETRNRLNEQIRELRSSVVARPRSFSTPSKLSKGVIDLTDEQEYEPPKPKKSPLADLKARVHQEELQEIADRIQMNQRQLRERAEAHRKEIEKLRNKSKTVLPPLLEDEEELISEVLDSGDDEDVIAEGFNIKVTRNLMSCLRDGEWLNDEVINFYLNVLMERGKSDQKKYPKCYFFNTFFFALLSEQGYSRVKKWTRKVDIFEMDKVVVPVHLGNHWCLAVINFRDKRFEYYDSLGSPNTSCLKQLRKYIMEEYKDKKKGTFDLSEYTDYMPSRTQIPQQQNGYDCGVFMCRYANSVSLDQSFTFSQKDMRYFRKRMVLDILSKSFSA